MNGSEYWTRIRTPSSFILMRQCKIQMRMRTVRYGMRTRMQMPGPWSVAVRYCILLRYRCEGGRADLDFGPDPRLSPQTGYRIFFKAKKCKNMNGSTQRWRGSAFFFQNIMFKIFLKLLGVTRIRIRILGSGSVKKFIKTKCK